MCGAVQARFIVSGLGWSLLVQEKEMGEKWLKSLGKNFFALALPAHSTQLS
jgi:hypothetical protein